MWMRDMSLRKHLQESTEWIFRARKSHANACSELSTERWALSTEHWEVMSYKLWVISDELWVMSYEWWVMSAKTCQLVYDRWEDLLAGRKNLTGMNMEFKKRLDLVLEILQDSPYATQKKRIQELFEKTDSCDYDDIMLRLYVIDSCYSTQMNKRLFSFHRK
jgi:hypothetical protein